MNAPTLPPVQQHLQMLIDRHGRRTAGSKRSAAQFRPILADKSSIGFNFTPETKEICYPIVATRSDGARLWDVDGNEYVDILLGLGTNLFGHNPPFVRDAIAAQLAAGMQMGPQSPLTGPVAALVTELTGLERVTFSNTGTEAVMTAIRIARTATRRPRIAVFSNSYHGHHDAALMRAPISEYARRKLIARLGRSALLRPLARLLEGRMRTGAVPAVPGIPRSVARDVMVLEYGNPRSLDALKDHHRDIAAVLVEPVQSRCPELQPREFLQALRGLTAETGVALVFDEMVTGFRIHAGGAQAHFGVRADIATYSKVAGGGLPLSIIAGSARFMDHIDGGPWQFGDDSAPRVPTTFFAGTFCRHPLALAAAQAVLLAIKTAGPALHAGLNARSAALVARLNAFTGDARLPVRFTCFGSFFAVAMTQSALSPLAQLLLSYNLMIRGIHLRVGDRGGFLCTTHTDADIDTIFTAFRDSLVALHEATLIHESTP
ncbi:MAG: aminotransferase class III-fold pyridoxal phosphate-dependent enzyme [Burkholderiales bacterium]|nr:aminotransferase class III-fold pyridoxal phosphate-dependent enzyme [Burkholderiales bacterium]